MFDAVVRYYLKMVDLHGVSQAMGYTLEMFEGLSEYQVEYILRDHM